MTKRLLRCLSTALLAGTLGPYGPLPVLAQEVAQGPSLATFKSNVDLVRVTAVVHDRKGRYVRDLSARDFEILDSGQTRRIADFRNDMAGVSVAFLFDTSGSMESRIGEAREAAEQVLSLLQVERDETAVFTFDTQLREVTPFSAHATALPQDLWALTPFGATSLYDAIAQTAQRGVGEGRRRQAVVVMTDGDDNASHLTPGEVSGIASAIDVPVYVFRIVSGIDNPSNDIAPTPRTTAVGDLLDLATWTGGDLFVASSPAERIAAARQIVDQLRHQYLLAFESTGRPGWHPLVVRARGKDLIVRARSGYIAGDQRPNFF
jgi:Ca-activated chloride channel homolog